MNITLQRSIDRFLGPLICGIFSIIYWLTPKRQVTGNPQRILIILLSEMGSLVLAYPMFKELSRKYPLASIHALVFDKNREVLDLLKVMPAENVLTLHDKSLTEFTADTFRVLRALYRLRFDTVIDCELFARVSSILSFLTGAERRVGFHSYTQEGLYRGSFINRPVMYNPYQHLSLQFLTLVEAIESHSYPTAKRLVTEPVQAMPRIAFRPGEVEAMRERVQRDFPGIAGRHLVLVYPSGGILPIRAWPMDYYQQLCRSLLDDGHAIGVVGLASDKSCARAVIEHCGDRPCADFTGYTKSVRELLALFELAELLVTNDGGPGQFSVLSTIPTIVFYGPETPQLYGPRSDNAIINYLSLSCSPCLTAYNHRNSPCDGDNQCLKRILPDTVYAQAREILAADQRPR